VISQYRLTVLNVIYIAFLDDVKKKQNTSPLAPIAVKILVSRCSAYKIETESGTMYPKKPNLSAPKNL
jgi:hypothetical protein